MTAFVASVTGPWNSAATWGGAGIPFGDTVTINDGITVTIPTGYTAVVGDSPANDTGTPAIQTASSSGTGILVMADGSGLTFKGPIRQTNQNWVIGKNCVITHDSSGAAVPSAAHYTWAIGVGSAAPARLTVNGTVGNRTTFGFAVGSGLPGGFHQATPSLDGGQLVATETTFGDWGTAAGSFIRPYLVTAGTKFTLDNCLVDRCGKISAFDVRLTSDFRLKNTAVRSPVTGVSIEADGSGNGFRAGVATGDWRLENVYIEGQVSLFNSTVNSGRLDFHFVNTVLAGTTSLAPLVITKCAQILEWNNVLLFDRVAATGSPSTPPSGTLTRSLLLRTGGTTNPHFLENINASSTWDGWLAEVGEAASVGGDIFQTLTAAAAYTLTVKNGVMIPDPVGVALGSVVNHSTSTVANGTTVFAPAVTAEHNTYLGDDATPGTGGMGGENNNGFAGLYASVRSNLVWKATSGTGYITRYHDGVTLVAGTYTVCDFNGYFNVTGERYYYKTVNPAAYGGTPGANDVNANPSFVDSTRKFLTWAQSVDATVTSWTDALNRFSLAYNDVGAIAGFTIAACYDWIRAGWAPTNTAFKGTAHDAGDIGAMAVVTTGLVGTIVSRVARRTVAAAGQPAIAGAASARLALRASLGGAGSAIDLTQLPSAVRQLPDWVAYAALNVPGMGRGAVFSDPVTGVRTTKLASLTQPAANATGFDHSYASGGYLISQPWGAGGDTYSLYIFADGSGAGFLQDYQLGVGLSGAARATPWSSDLRYCFSPIAGEPHIAYYFAVNKLKRFDTTAGVMAEAPTATFPVGGKDFSSVLLDQGQYIQVDVTGRYFVWMNGAGDTVYWWDSQTNTTLVLTEAQLGAAIDEPHMDRDGRYVYVKMSVGLFQHLWDTSTDTFSASFATLSHDDGLEGRCIGIDGNDGAHKVYTPAPLAGGRAASPVAAVGTLTTIGTDSQINADDSHRAGQWRQGAIGASQYTLISTDAPGSIPTLAAWALDAGSVYKTTVTYRFEQSVTHVGVVSQLNTAGTAVVSRLTKAASRAAMVAGSWFLAADNVTLYVWRADSAAPDGTTHQVLVQVPGVIHEGLAYLRLDRGDVRLLGHHYSFNPPTDYFSSPRATIAIDGRIAVFTSNQGVSGGPKSAFVMEAPRAGTSAGQITIAGSASVRLPTKRAALTGTVSIGTLVGTIVSRVAATRVAAAGTLSLLGTLAARVRERLTASGTSGQFSLPVTGATRVKFNGLHPTFVSKLGDTVPPRGTLLGDAVQALQGAIVRLNLRRASDDQLVLDHIVCRVIDSANGVVEFPQAYLALDTTNVGGLYGEFEVTFGDTSILSFPNGGHFVGELVAAVS